MWVKHMAYFTYSVNICIHSSHYLWYLLLHVHELVEDGSYPANTIRINTYFFGTYYLRKSVDSFLSLCYVVRYVVVHYILKYVTLM